MAAALSPTVSAGLRPTATPPGDLKHTFQKTTGELFFGQLVKALRQTAGKPAYLHGGQAEELFQSQLDQTLVEHMAESHGGPFVEDLYRQYRHQLGLPAESTPSSQSSHLVPSGERTQIPSLSELMESSRQAQSAENVSGFTTGATGISALLRK